MTKSGDNRDADAVPCELIRLGSYKWPRSETRQTLGHLYQKIRAGLSSDVSQDAIDTQDLTLISDAPLKKEVLSILDKILGDMLERRYGEWATETSDRNQRRAFVHPPLANDLLSDWAERHDLPVLHPENTLDDFPDAPCVVIPHLEAFFSRETHQLAPLFDLFAAISRFEGKVLVGCNSWAWRYLKQFDDAPLLFGEADTQPAFDGDALAAILERAASESDDRNRFTSVSSGESILARDDDNELKDSYLEKLAGRSLGHPWIAVEMFFRSIAETKEKDEESPADRIWVDLPATCSLPSAGADALRFALHALMIHGPRPIEELNKLLPDRVPHGTWTELDRIGFVTIRDGHAQCAIHSYPDIRSELGTAGFNLDRL